MRARSGIRTRDLHHGKVALYQLSYSRTLNNKPNLYNLDQSSSDFREFSCHSLRIHIIFKYWLLISRYIFPMVIKHYLLMHLLCLVLLASPAQARDNTKDPVIEHLADAYTWHFVCIGHHHLTLYLPIIIYTRQQGLCVFSSGSFWDVHHQVTAYRGFVLKEGKIVSLQGWKVYDLSITKNVASMLLSLLLLLLLFFGLARHCKGKQARSHPFWILLFYWVEFVRNHIARKKIGAKYYEQYTPFLLTLFSFIFMNNFLGLLPGAANVTGNFSVTLSLSLFSFFLTNLNGNKHYWQHIFNPPGVPKWILPIIVPIELLGVLTKIFTLAMRLFANILAGHLMLGNIIALIFIMQSVFSPFVSIPLGVFVILMECFVAFFQAYLFTLLSATYLGAAVGHE